MDDIEPAIQDHRFCLRVTHYLDGLLPEPELKILSSELSTDRAKQSLFAQMCILRAGLDRGGQASRTANDLANQKSGESFFGTFSDHVDPLVNEPATGDVLEADSTSLKIQPAPQKQFKKLPWIGLSSAAILLIGLLIWAVTGNHTSTAPTSVAVKSNSPARPPDIATVTASAAVSDGGKPIESGTKLTPGNSLYVVAGALELTLKRGATLVFTGPGKLQVIDDNSVVLSSGTLVARVPAQAQGFTANCLGLSAMDMGTEFGMRVDDANTTVELSVFKGKVQATELDENDQPIGESRVIVAGHAITHNQSTPGTLTATAFDPSVFPRTIQEAGLPVPAHGTGVDIASGQPDPQWRLVSAPADLHWVAGPALRVKDVRRDYAHNTLGANWISAVADTTSMPVGDFVYETDVDLSGFDPGTVRSSMIVAVDDFIHEVRVNGVPAKFNPDADASYYFHPRNLSFVSHAWHPGQNKVEVIVTNRDDGLATNGNPTALQLQWAITAQTIPKH